MTDDRRFLFRWLFAVIVFGACFYGIVLYEFNLDDLKTGALISLMTLAVQFVLVEGAQSSTARRQQAAFDSGVASGSTTTTTTEPGTTTVTSPPPAPTDSQTQG